MAEVKWIKIVTDIFNDEKILLIESMPDADAVIVIWFKLLCLAGHQNNSGVFIMANGIPYTEEMLSTIMRRPLNTVRMALSIFEQYGMVEIIDSVITIPNWDKHQSLDALEAKRARDRSYQAGRREKQKQLAENNRLMSDDSSDDNRSAEEDKKEIREEREEDKKESKEKEPEASPLASGGDELEKVFNDFLEMRQSMGNPLTGNSLNSAIKKLQTFPKEQWVAIVQQSIDKRWQSFYPLKAAQATVANKACSSDPSKYITEKNKQAVAFLLENYGD